MARGIIRKPSFNKIVGAYRSQWKRFWMRLFTFGMYGRKGVGWWRDSKKAWYNFWYHRTSISVYKLLGCKPSRGACFFAMICASVISIFAAPVDATRAGVTAHKIKNERKVRSEGKSSRSGGSYGSAKTSTHTSTNSTTRNTITSNTSFQTTSEREYTKPKITTSTMNRTASSTKTTPMSKSKSTTVAKVTPLAVEEKPKNSYNYSFTTLFPKTEPITPTVFQKQEEPKEPDENTPKSKPKHENDQYIRKRMIIAGSSYCDAATLEKLSVGTYFDLIAEPDNPYDKDAVMLTLGGEKIGYIAKSDRLAFVTCLKLKRKIYGVVTAIDMDSKPTKYEFETWFDQMK